MKKLYWTFTWFWVCFLAIWQWIIKFFKVRRIIYLFSKTLYLNSIVKQDMQFFSVFSFFQHCSRNIYLYIKGIPCFGVAFFFQFYPWFTYFCFPFYPSLPYWTIEFNPNVKYTLNKIWSNPNLSFKSNLILNSILTN
jgi:hypothetical protein